MNLKIGDPVIVYDKGLIMLQKFYSDKPNNKGWVNEIWDDGTILVEFPIGDDNPNEHSQVSPYLPKDVSFDPRGTRRNNIKNNRPYHPRPKQK